MTINNLKILTTIFLLLTLLSCRKDPLVSSDTDELYTPYLTSYRDNRKVTLKWGKPICLYPSCIFPQSDPDHFEILISSTDPSDLSVHSTVSNNIFEVTINHLTDGTPYYFAIKAIGHKQFAISNKVMTIPDNPEIIQALFQTIDKSKEQNWVYAIPWKIEWSASGNKILFTSNSNSFRTLYTVAIAI